MTRCLALLVLLAPGPLAATEATLTPHAAPVPWVTLHFEARKLLLVATSVIRHQLVSAEEVAPLLREPPGEAGLPLPSRLVQLTITTDLPLGRDEEVRTWLHPTTFAALATAKRTFGRRPSTKLFRYAPGGYYEWRRAPAHAGEASGEPERWSKTREGWARAAHSVASSALIIDPYALLYMVSAAQLHRPGGQASVAIVSRGALVELSIVDGGLTRRRVDYRELSPQGESFRRGEVLVRMVHVRTSAPAGTARGDVQLGFLGAEGELVIALDAASGLPLEFSGHTRAAGVVVARLVLAELPPSGPSVAAAAPPAAVWHTAK